MFFCKNCGTKNNEGPSFVKNAAPRSEGAVNRPDQKQQALPKRGRLAKTDP